MLSPRYASAWYGSECLQVWQAKYCCAGSGFHHPFPCFQEFVERLLWDPFSLLFWYQCFELGEQALLRDRVHVLGLFWVLMMGFIPVVVAVAYVIDGVFFGRVESVMVFIISMTNGALFLS